MSIRYLYGLCICTAFSLITCQTATKPQRVLVFSKTEGYRHASIAAGKEMFLTLGQNLGIRMDTTEEATYFTEDSLKQYSAVVFLNTTLDVLNHVQQADFERYIQAGGGFLGIHAAADTEYDWPWYGQLVGAYFESHPKVQEATIHVDHQDPSQAAQTLPADWTISDEWYNYKNIHPDLQVIATLDESTYEGGKNGEHHPIIWYHEFDGGRAFYTGRGHTPEAFQEADFQEHIGAGLSWVMGDNRLDYAQATSMRVPEQERLIKTVLATNLDEPMELVVFDDHKIMFIERKGAVQVYHPQTGVLKKIKQMPVHTEFEDGLLGLAKDPNFTDNHWLYMFYSPVGDIPKQHVSRFQYDPETDSLDLSSEQLLLEIPVQRDECCHSAGSLEFGPDGNLFISLGDDTSPFNIQEQTYNADGYAPLNEKPGFSAWDAQKSSGNTNDLRGAILRITPTDDGTYAIPDGNLFPKDGSGGRPEIYVKGCRNPFRMSIDSRRGWLYWGDVGPDAGEDHPDRGPRGHDEVNQARKAGYFGWPYFVGDNKPYKHFDYVTGTSAEDFYDPQRPVNRSPNNTGAEILPPAQPAFIWYPYAASKEFPLVGTGGRNAMAGPTYYYDDYEGPHQLPEYYDGKFIAYDWIRGWMMAITLDEEGDLAKMEPFLDHLAFNNPVDIEMAEDGTMYVLEYGTNWFARNPDAKLSRIEYLPGNRPPLARISADQTVGAAPLTVAFSAAQSRDPDENGPFTYRWAFAGAEGESTDQTATHTFDQPGVYKARVSVTDKAGETGVAELEIRVGNEPPSVSLDWPGNRSFYWDNEVIPYQVSVSDREDGNDLTGGVYVSFDYLPIGQDVTLIEQGHKMAGSILNGLSLMENSDCFACHQMNEQSIGPSYTAVADRYEADDATVKLIAAKIIHGGGGNWGEQAMAAHPQVSLAEAEAMAKYILKLDEKKGQASLPLSGKLAINRHKPGERGIYVFNATYTDQGGTLIGPLTTEEEIRLRPARMAATEMDAFNQVRTRSDEASGRTFINQIGDGSWVSYEQVDLREIAEVVLLAGANSKGFTVHLRRSLAGNDLGSAPIPVQQGDGPLQAVRIPVGDHTDMGPIWLYFSYEGEDDRPGATLEWLQFNRKPGGSPMAIR